MTTLDSYLRTVSQRPLRLSNGEARSYTYTLQGGRIYQPATENPATSVALSNTPTLYEAGASLGPPIRLKLGGATEFLEEVLQGKNPYDLLLGRIPNETDLGTREYRTELKIRFLLAVEGNTSHPELYDALFFKVVGEAGLRPGPIRKNAKRARRYLREFLSQSCQKLDRRLSGSGRVVGFQYEEPIVEGPPNNPAFNRLVQDFFQVEIRNFVDRIPA